jgi:hypothetical protein
MTLRVWSLAVAMLLVAGADAAAQGRCRVLDPTGTPLNVRTSPYGTVIGTLANGVLVSVIDQSTDRNGRPWVYVAAYDSSRPIGWVYREFIACF